MAHWQGHHGKGSDNIAQWQHGKHGKGSANIAQWQHEQWQHEEWQWQCWQLPYGNVGQWHSGSSSSGISGVSGNMGAMGSGLSWPSGNMGAMAAPTWEQREDLNNFNQWAAQMGKGHLVRPLDSPPLAMYGATIVEQRKAIDAWSKGLLLAESEQRKGDDPESDQRKGDDPESEQGDDPESERTGDDPESGHDIDSKNIQALTASYWIESSTKRWLRGEPETDSDDK